MSLFLLGLVFSGCSSTDKNNGGSVSTTGTDRIALFKDNVRSDINPNFDESARREIDKANFEKDKPDRVGPGPSTPEESSIYASDSCASNDIIVDHDLLAKLFLPEEGGLECLIVDVPAAYLGCIRTPLEKLNLDSVPLGVSIGTSKPYDGKNLTPLVLSHATITIRSESMWRQILIDVMICPKNSDLEVCLFDYSPKKFIADILHIAPSINEPSQTLSLAATDAQIIAKVIEDMKLGTGRVLGIIARKREASPGLKVCTPLEFYTIN